MTDRKKPRGEMLMDIGAQAVKVECARKHEAGSVPRLKGITDHESAKLWELCREYIDTQRLEP